MAPSTDGALPPDAGALIADYYRLSDLADHLRALPEAARSIGVRDVSPEYLIVLQQLEDEVLDRLERLDALGLYPATTTDLEVTVNGVPIALPELDCDAPTATPLPRSTQAQGDRMETIPHDFDHDTNSNGFDLGVMTQDDGPSFVERNVTPYVAYLVTFAVGAMFGVVGARMLGGTTDVTA